MNSVSAAVTAARPRPVVRTRRTAVTFDGVGAAQGSGMPQFSTAISDFADLAHDPESVVVGGRLFSPANLIAAVVNGLVAGADEPIAGAVATYPAVYSDKQVALLRQALDLAGARAVMLVPEPVAAAEWLESEHGPVQPGFVLVYDLGGNSLDVAVVRVGPDWENHPIIGKPLRSYEFGGRPLGARIARCARGSTSDGLVSSMSMRDVDGLRTAHIRKSFDLVRQCVRGSGRTLSDIDRILVVGGAARPREVARTLAELGRPVVVSADPGQVVAAGAAQFAVRVFAPAEGAHHPPRVAVFSSAAVASALALSAATVFGGGVDPDLSPLLEYFPNIGPSSDVLLYEPTGDVLTDLSLATGVPRRSVQATLVGYAAGLPSGLPVAHTGNPAARPQGPTLAESTRSRLEQQQHNGLPAATGVLYANPARFTNPLPFVRSKPAPAPAPAPAPNPAPSVPPAQQPPAANPIPSVSLPADQQPAVPAPSAPQPATPGTGTTTPPDTGVSTPGTGTPGTGTPGTGTTPPGTGTSTPDPGTATPGTGTGTSSPGTGTGTSSPGTGTGTSSPGTGTGGNNSSTGTGTSSSGTNSGTSSGGLNSGDSTSGTSSNNTSSGMSNTTSGTSSNSSSSGTSSSSSSSGTSSNSSSSGTSSSGTSSSSSSSSSNSGGSNSSGGGSGYEK
ncbi:Hsp70 family protein [Nocardia sp. NPDC050435]|uniref:Hsp70 family protein n=1 Tax=Nocardia sp. NPDC050435 TaxID=3155040 RepID=UPI0033F2370F